MTDRVVDETVREPGPAAPETATSDRAPGALARIVSLVLPGVGHVLAGHAFVGMWLVLLWGALLGSVWLGRDAIRAIGAAGSLDDWVALVTLAVGLLLVWGWAQRDLARADTRKAAIGDSQWRIAGRHLRRDPLALAGAAVMLGLYLVAVLAPFLAPYDPIAQGDIVATGFLSPSWEHWFGTDRFGRDVLTRMIYGARISLTIAFVAVTISIILGTLVGAAAGYFGGKIDGALMRFTDMVLAFPRLILLIMIVALFGASIPLIIIVLGLTQWPSSARLVRGEVLSLREREYIQAARALGYGSSRIVLRHLVPNVLAPVIVAATLGIGNTIVLEAGLSFLGLGVQPPTPSWGNMVADGGQSLIGAWWVATFPGLAIVVSVLAFNLLGDGLRDALDPRLRT
ncbi:MAG TPA: ABC transporter permease [Longimicrobiales bacterium]|nr:ABC transporter permease [Longimicrobiales bacterium]